MKLAVFNGSPRGRASNTDRILEYFLAGFSAVPGNEYEQFYLMREKDPRDCAEALKTADRALLAFPLYTDCMPGIVLEFLEALASARGDEYRIPLCFIIHSGFPESFHSHPLRDYLEKYCRRYGHDCPGTVIKGGSEGIRAQPESTNRKFLGPFRELGEVFGRTGGFDEEIVRQLARPVRFSTLQRPVAWLGAKLGELVYWRVMLKKNDALGRRDATPYRDITP